ncbi:MAG TPA: D-alanine--D-alanine ligase [Candidatus Lachnoclostridium pullistercoris]|uniref:D-alanine--D-alanine ligase n=1 Tax=Candidatus Lachnoclostridium pullistercoris TaxID=2838632 RepID=A0A9D2PCM9_9FIRM|nr:D-alanine--D-alanine ligase [Candidatus Lachnoclostridium pullistercoris]
MKQTVAVIFGGQSSEHEVSCMSVVNVASQIDREKYDVLLIGITKEGHWVKVDSVESIQDGTWKESRVGAVVSPDATEKCVILSQEGQVEKRRVDVAFPVLHGLYGEDGTIQGIFELAQIPYVGCGVLASAVSMDKLFTKIIVDDLGIRQAQYVPVRREELHDMEAAENKVEARLSYPVFVKPSNAGSSRGVSKAENREELAAALKEAARHDSKILVEETIVGHEVECAVFGGGKTPVRASGVGEVLAAADFYDFDAKYYNPESRTVVNPPLPGNAAEEIRTDAVKIFKAVDGYGLSRVDFFVKESGEVVFNEINTMPGFTAISMYPMLWEAAGMDKKALVQALIDHAFARYDRG